MHKKPSVESLRIRVNATPPGYQIFPPRGKGFAQIHHNDKGDHYVEIG